LTFSDPKIVEMLKQDFVPVAIDQWYQRRQKDAEGDFYRKVAGQGPRSDFEKTTQGRYVCTADGKLLGYNNNRGPDRIRELMVALLKEFDSSKSNEAKPIDATQLEYDLSLPKGGLSLRVHSKILSGYQQQEGWRKVFVESVGRDNCWLTADEQRQLAETIVDGGSVSPKIAQRIARFHLIDNTRGEPPRWKIEEIKRLELSVVDGVIKGRVELETADGKRGFQADILGKATANVGTVSRFDFIAKGKFWGNGPYTGHGPEGEFPLVVAFRVGDGRDVSDQIIPHGAKGWIEGYYK
jgi:hypothetical protein